MISSKKILTKNLLILAFVTMFGFSALADTVEVLVRAGDQVSIDGEPWILVSFMNSVVTPPPLTAGSGGTGVIAYARRPTDSPFARTQVVLYFSNSGNLIAAARQGLAAPNSNGALFGGFDSPAMSSSGDFMVKANLTGPGVVSGGNSRSFYRFRQTTVNPLVKVAREGEIFGLNLISNIRQIVPFSGAMSTLSAGAAFKAVLVDENFTSFADGVFRSWVDSQGALLSQQLYRSDQTLPISSDGTLGRLLSPQVIQGAAEHLVVYGVIIGDGVTRSVNDTALWRVDSGGVVQFVARQRFGGTGVAGTSFSSLYTASRLPLVNGRGDVAFAAALEDSSGAFVKSGIWTTRSGALRPALLSGIPGPDGTTVGSLQGSFTFKSHFLLGDGSIAVVAPLTGPGVNTSNDRFVLLNSQDGEYSIIARGGVPQSFLPSGVSLVNSSLGSSILTNERGDIVFRGILQGQDVTSLNSSAIFMSTVVPNAMGGERRITRMLAREGQQIASNGLELGELQEMGRWLNNRGTFVFVAPSRLNGNAGPVVLMASDEAGVLRPVFSGINGGRLLPNPSLAIAGFETDAQFALNEANKLVASVQLSDSDASWGGEAVILYGIESDTERCLADFNDDGEATIQDIFDYLPLYLAYDTRADFNHDGTTTTQDLFDYLNAWFAGCP